MKDALIFVLLGLLIWFGLNIIRLEKYHYASMLGMCDEQTVKAKKELCLDAMETRTHPIWHLVYGLRML